MYNARVVNSSFAMILKQLRESRKMPNNPKKTMTKSYVAEKVGKSVTYISELESGKKPAPGEVCEAILRAIGATTTERLELLLAARAERFDESDYVFFEIDDFKDVKEIVSKRFGPIFNNERMVDLLFNEAVMETLQTIDKMPEEKRPQFIQAMNALAKGFL